jgi:hypothetical protein
MKMKLITVIAALLVSSACYAQGPAGVGTKNITEVPEAWSGKNSLPATGIPEAWTTKNEVPSPEVLSETPISTSTTAPLVVPRKKKPFLIRFAIAGGACGLGIGLSANPATSAEIGVPILLGGNYLAWRLYQNHPGWSKFVQAVSPLGCFGYKGAKHKVAKKPATQGGHEGGTGGTTNPPSGGGGGTTTPPGDGGGTTPPGGPGGGGGGTPPPGGHCIQDCGIPGNGGLNGGHDLNKPPFPGHGPKQVPGTGNGKP